MKGNIAAVFPGQGSQSVGMLSSYLSTYPSVAKLCANASRILGYDVPQLLKVGPKAKLDSTIYTQPAILCASYAIWQVWQAESKSIRPKLLAGHSLGEFSALLCAETFQFEDALNLVMNRAQYMQASSDEAGAMAAVLGLEDDDVIAACQAYTGNEVVSAANFNAPGQVVIAGHKSAVKQTIDYIKQHYPSKRVMMLPVSIASHCAMMKQASDQLAQLLTSIPMQSPKIPVIHNVIVDTLTHPDDIRQVLVEQLYSPVRWRESVETMLKNSDITAIIECGPGKVLSGLNKRINKRITVHSFAELDDFSAYLNTKEES